ncbi:uncharacterized protein LOC129719790 [Wyeomyia smithii]|uniref:uncharacterized protein LOC129719790 n=1 Tax=Wyeomyia smithii TaxID=174621 RepID=UPI002467BBC0|nr:uncharacterized protein LOC129719790 [Wyeomyia smithii]
MPTLYRKPQAASVTQTRLANLYSTAHVNLGGVAQTVTSISKAVQTNIFSRTSGFSQHLKFLVLPSISSNQPAQVISTVDWEIPSWITLADPTFGTPGPVDALLGAGIFFQLLRYGKLTIGRHPPLLQNTVLGWIVSGECLERESSPPKTSSCHLTHNQRLEKLVARFWELEQCYSNICWSPAEKSCEQHFKSNVPRNKEGRYVVRLPMKLELLPRLRDNRFKAQRRYLALERKLEANPSLRCQYSEFINEYLQLGHMRLVTSEELANENLDLPRYFLPHHAILRPESTTTKLRTVFDASCKSNSGLSLNDVLYAGPTIQDTLLAIVLRFRMHAFVITGDIAKMYRQILVHPNDQPLQRIFWRDNTSKPLETYQLLTVTYGTSSAPFLATRVLQQLAEDGINEYPLAAAVVRKDMYMDDLLTGCDDLKMMFQLCAQLMQIFGNAGMQLRKISSNNHEILNMIPNDCRETKTLVEFDSETPVKALGLLWEPSSDSIRYKLPKLSRCERYTKRIVLAQTSSFFDPLGLIGPAIVKAKIVLQTLWKLEYDWDQPLPKAFATDWEQYQSQFSCLGKHENVYLWSDSTIVLHWLFASPSTWLTFIANRVAEIQEITENCTWNHVPGEQNPADLISRGVHLSELIDSSLWWNGPPWLAAVDQPWPQLPEELRNVKQKDLETRKGVSLSIVVQNEPNLYTKYSSFTTLLRMSALCKRFADNCRTRRRRKQQADSRLHECRIGPLSVDELNETLLLIIGQAQREQFATELSALKEHKPVPNQSRLRFLNPELHNNLIRVSGRLKHAGIPSDAKNPLVLPAKHPLTRLIAETTHRQQLHCGPQLLLATLHQRFWPLGGRNLVRDVVHACVTCAKARPRYLSQLMGSLPAVRVTRSYVFENVGIDFAGPFYLRRSSPRASPNKSYVAVFVCMATKATHLDHQQLSSPVFVALLQDAVGHRIYTATTRPTLWGPNGKFVTFFDRRSIDIL